MPVTIPAVAPTSLAAASLKPAAPVMPSPVDWRDQFLYFLLPDRFSDGQESTRVAYSGDPSLHPVPSVADWMAAGTSFQGGTIAGIKSKLPYLKGLGVTALWVGPVFKQRMDPGLITYHGYGIQNFLEVDPRFGTRQDLRALVDAAHALGIYVILDIIYNHTGNNFYYKDDSGKPVEELPYRFSPHYDRVSWRSGAGAPTAAIAGPDDGVWPTEFQNDEFYTRAGSIGRFDPADWENRLDPRNEFRRGDFFSLKDLRVQERQPFVFDPDAARVVDALIKVYQYWIALTDCDGFRVDTVKHVSFEASRNFCGAIHEYAESIGKENFLVLGEVAGGAGITRDYLDVFGRNIDAALDLGAPMDILAATMKGFCNPGDFFAQFGGHDDLGSHREVGRYHVSVLNDHDMIGRKPRQRFCAGGAPALQVAHVTGIQLTTLGIPCIYYGTEQGFDGSDTRHDASVQALDSKGVPPDNDRYIREAMFGATFGAFQTSGCHFFNTSHPAYLRIAAIARVVMREDMIGKALRRGRQYARDVRFLSSYLPPHQGELVAWSRIFFHTEVVVAVNTNGAAARGGFATVDSALHPPGSTLNVLYRGDWTDAELAAPPVEPQQPVIDDGGRSVVRIDLPAAGMIILG
jgi:glycosidase